MGVHGGMHTSLMVLLEPRENVHVLSVASSAHLGRMQVALLKFGVGLELCAPLEGLRPQRLLGDESQHNYLCREIHLEGDWMQLQS